MPNVLYLSIHDRMTIVDLVIYFYKNENREEAEKIWKGLKVGTLILMKNFYFTTKLAALGTDVNQYYNNAGVSRNGDSYLKQPVCLAMFQVNDHIKIMGAEGCGIVGDPEHLHDIFNVKRALLEIQVNTDDQNKRHDNNHYSCYRRL